MISGFFLLIQERSGRHGFTTVSAMAQVQPHPDVVEEVKATLQAAAVLLPKVEASEGEGLMMHSSPRIQGKSEAHLDPCRKCEIQRDE